MRKALLWLSALLLFGLAVFIRWVQFGEFTIRSVVAALLLGAVSVALVNWRLDQLEQKRRAAKDSASSSDKPPS